MRDFTLIIPTYNRNQLLATLLNYLEAEKPDCRVLVLDSSRPDMLAANRARVATCGLDIEFAEFPNLEPTEKWRLGVHKVTTPFCAFCADDDLVILDGVRQCLDALRSNPAASVVEGYTLTFLPRADGDMELNNIVYFRPSIDASSPLERLDKLFQQYQALVYGVFRTPALQRTLDALQLLTKTLSRELLWSALTVIEGQVIRVPQFSYGRSMGPSAAYDCWHPLEWFCKDPDSLFAEYLRYRELAAAAILHRPDNGHNLDDIYELLDMIHLRYLARHAPESAVEFITRQQIAEVDFSEYWPRHEIHLPLYDAAGIGSSEQTETLAPLNLRGLQRSYLLFPNFYAPRGVDRPQIDKIGPLISVLDSYRGDTPFEPPDKSAMLPG
jgi:glycosyltransferase domain-containing protein